jgi:hypothetical protein
LPTIRYATVIAMPATMNANVGAISAGISSFESSLSPDTPSVPTATTTAPTTPPINACDELDGRPKYHVARFQMIAPIRPPKTISGVTIVGSTKSFATVAATSSEMKAPAKLSSAEYSTATRGAIARVETIVAIAFAVS